MQCNRWIILGLLSFITGCSATKTELPAPRAPSFAVYYDYQAQGEDFSDFDLVVLDSAQFPPLDPIKAVGTTVFGYVSIGEVRGDEQAYQFALEKGIVLDDNPDWDSHIIDIRSPWWHRYILEFAIPALIKDGFEGVMFDTIESPMHVASSGSDAEIASMRQGAVALIRAVHTRYPDFPIMLNRGLDIVPQVAPLLHSVLAESILAVPDEQRPGKFRFLKPSFYQSIVTLLQQAQRKNPHLKIYTLDYWQMNDNRGIQKLYKTQRDQGFIPYISTPDLRILHKEKQQ